MYVFHQIWMFSDITSSNSFSAQTSFFSSKTLINVRPLLLSFRFLIFAFQSFTHNYYWAFSNFTFLFSAFSTLLLKSSSKFLVALAFNNNIFCFNFPSKNLNLVLFMVSFLCWNFNIPIRVKGFALFIITLKLRSSQVWHLLTDVFPTISYNFPGSWYVKYF